MTTYVGYHRQNEHTFLLQAGIKPEILVLQWSKSVCVCVCACVCVTTAIGAKRTHG
jgi:hypothetical protein